MMQNGGHSQLRARIAGRAITRWHWAVARVLGEGMVGPRKPSQAHQCDECVRGSDGASGEREPKRGARGKFANALAHSRDAFSASMSAACGRRAGVVRQINDGHVSRLLDWKISFLNRRSVPILSEKR
jgi:hypothetical protein